jgi:uncharacterized protein YbcI
VPEQRLNQAIANAVAAIYHAHLGRGPRTARAFRQQDLIVVLMHDGFGPSERLLIDEGREQAVLDLRRQLHEALRPRLVEAIEDVTGQRVAADMSAMHISPDLAVEMFLLEGSVPA